MENKKNPVISVIVLVLIVALGAALLIGVNAYTAPLIEANSAGSAAQALLKIFPDAESFDLIYSADDPASSALTDVPETVRSIYSETSGLGWVVNLSTTAGFTGEPMEIALGVDSEGRICSSEVVTYPDTKDFGADYPLTYLGQDSTLADVALVSGATFSSKAFKGAVEDAFAALVGNDLMAAGEKGAAQLLTELIPSVHPGLANPDGVLQCTELEAGAEGIAKALMSPEDNSVGGAFIVGEGDAMYLVITNASGCTAAFGPEGDPADVDAAVLEKVSALSLDNTVSHSAEAEKKLSKLLSDSAVFEPVKLEGVFSSVSDAFVITDGDETFYGFAARPYGYSNMVMTFYYVLDSEGAIVKMTADELILIKEYFSAYELDESAYKNGLTGLKADGVTGEETLITGATCSSNASSAALNDVFAAFAILNENGGFAA